MIHFSFSRSILEALCSSQNHSRTQKLSQKLLNPSFCLMAHMCWMNEFTVTIGWMTMSVVLTSSSTRYKCIIVDIDTVAIWYAGLASDRLFHPTFTAVSWSFFNAVDAQTTAFIVMLLLNPRSRLVACDTIFANCAYFDPHDKIGRYIWSDEE